jgi:hypothetical protein
MNSMSGMSQLPIGVERYAFVHRRCLICRNAWRLHLGENSLQKAFGSKKQIFGPKSQATIFNPIKVGVWAIFFSPVRQQN